MDLRPLSIPAYRRLWLASVVTAVGGSFSVVAVPAQLFAMTGTSATVGLSAVLSFAGLIVAALRAGALADTHDRRTVLFAATLGLGATYLLLGLVGGRSVFLLLALVAVQGLTYGAVLTTTGATVPRLVPAELLTAANALSSLTRYGGAIVGPVLAGALLPVTGAGLLYLCDAAALLAVLAAVARLPLLPPAGERRTPAPIAAGLRYLRGHRLLLGVLGIDLAAMVFGLPLAVFPELAARTYAGPAGGGADLGLLYAAYPAGVITAGLCSGALTRTRRPGLMLAGAALTWGCTVVALALAGNLPAALAALVAGGAANFVLSTFRNTLTQAHTDDALRGRIQGCLVIVTAGGPQLGNLLHGTAAAGLGPRTAIGAGGVLTVLGVAAILYAVPTLRR